MTSSQHTTTTCPKCGTLHRVAKEHLGQLVSCINCQEQFTAQENQTLIEPTQQDDDQFNLAPIPEEMSQQSHPPVSHYGLTPQHTISGFTPTSRLAIASLCCGIGGIFTCCFFLPSIIAIVLGAVSLGSIRSGETRGRGLAIAGIITGIIGCLIGVTFWIMSTLGPELTPISGQMVSDEYRQTLENLGALHDQEEIILFYSNGFLSIEETGVIITADRLVTYDQDLGMTDTPLEDINLVEYRQGETMFGMSQFEVETDNEDRVYFEVSTQEFGDRKFYDTLRNQVSDARETAGKPAPTIRSLDIDESD